MLKINKKIKKPEKISLFPIFVPFIFFEQLILAFLSFAVFEPIFYISCMSVSIMLKYHNKGEKLKEKNAEEKWH